MGGAAAYLVGLYNDQPQAAASNGGSVWDVIPGDIVAHAIIGAAAAAACPGVREHVAAPPKEEGGAKGPMIVQVGSSCSYPLSFADMFNTGGATASPCGDHRQPVRLLAMLGPFGNGMLWQ